MSANEYNDKYVSIFAPNGFPSWCYYEYNERAFKYGSRSFAQWIKGLQRRLGITVDGYCGPSTIDAIAKMDLKHKRQKVDQEDKNKFIIIGAQAMCVDFPVVGYFDDFTMGDTATRVRKNEIHQIVTHYDVSYTAEATESILQNRGYSTHFIIDGDKDATIYQCHNPATKVAFHAGQANERSIGIDLNNPADTKYKEVDARNRGRSRVGEVQEIHGKKVERLTFFPEQKECFRHLCNVLCKETCIPLEYPKNEDGSPIYGYFADSLKFKGIIGHYHLTERKTDPAPLKWEEVFPTAKKVLAKKMKYDTIQSVAKNLVDKAADIKKKLNFFKVNKKE